MNNAILRTMVTIEVLGVPVAVPARLSEAFAELTRTDATPAITIDATEAAIALPELTRAVVARTPYLCIHAAVLAGPSGLLAIPGPSGLGKTTLSAVLMEAGFGYLSDEVLAMDSAGRVAASFPRPLALDAQAWPLIKPGLGPPPASGRERLIPPSSLGLVDQTTGPLAEVLLCQRIPGPQRIQSSQRAAAVAELLRRSFNHYRDPEASFRAVVAAVRAARVWQVQFESARDLGAILADQLAETDSAATASK